MASVHFLLYVGRRLRRGEVKADSTRAVTVTDWAPVISSKFGTATPA